MKRRFVTDAMKKQMRELEAQGKTRKEIADDLDLHPSAVTKHLGAVRQFRGLRVPRAA